MVERKEVEALLEGTAEENGRADRHVPPETLAALCRAWLALDGAPVADVQWDGGADAYLVFDGGPEEMRGCRWNDHMSEQLEGQRVRIVKEPSK